MKRSRALSASVRIEDLHYAKMIDPAGRQRIAVVGRVVNKSNTTLSLLAIHLGLTQPKGLVGNVAVIAKPEQLAPGASKTFAFVIEPSAVGSFAPIRDASQHLLPISAEEQRGLGQIAAYVTYAGE